MNQAQESQPLLDFKKERIVKGRGLHVKALGCLRDARGVPQAVVKVVRYMKGYRATARLVDYISRKGELEIETEDGEIYSGQEEQRKLVRSWASNFDSRIRGRDVVHLVYSMPKGVDTEAIRNTIRDIVVKDFGNHESLFGIHEDTDHRHAHVLVVMRGKHKDKKLRINKEQLHELRESYADVARGYGVEMNVSPRSARGVGEKGKRLAFYHMRKEGRIPNVEKSAVSEALKEISLGIERETPWEKAIARRHKKVKDSKQELADTLRRSAETAKSASKDVLLKMALEIDAHNKSLQEPKTRRQRLFAYFKKLIERRKETVKEIPQKAPDRDSQLP